MLCSVERSSHIGWYFRYVPNIKDKNFVINRLEFSKEFSSEYTSAIAYLFERLTTECREKSYDNAVCFCESMQSDIEKNFFDIHFRPGSANRDEVEYMYREFINMFKDWMVFMDECIGEQAPPKSLKFIDCVTLNDCGVIDYKKTAERLLVHPEIDDTDRLKIACVHCLENDVRRMAKNVEFPYSPLKVCNEKTAAIIEFWKKYLKNDKCGESVEDLLHHVNCDNEPAMRFFWCKLNAGQKCYNLPYVFANSSTYTQCTWLNEMTGEQQLSIMSKCGGQVLRNMRKSFIWSDYYFLVAFFARDVIPDDQYYAEIVEMNYQIIEDSHESLIIRNIGEMLRILWSYLPCRAKRFFFQQKNCESTFSYISEVSDCDFLNQVIADGPREFKEKLLFSYEGLNMLWKLVNDERFIEFNKLFKTAWPLVDEAVEYKIKFVNTEEGCDVVLRYPISEGNKDDFDGILKKIFQTKTATNKFKKQFLFNAKSLDVFGVLVYRVFYTVGLHRQLRESLDFKEVLTVVRWFLSKPQEIDRFKATRLCHIEEVKKKLLRILQDECFGLMDRFLKWSFNDHLQAVAVYKENLFDKKLKSQWYYLVFHLMQKDNRFEAMDKLVSWLYTERNKQEEFKKLISESFPKMHHLLKYLLCEGRFDVADTFLKWCGIRSPFEMIAYKKKLPDSIRWGNVIGKNASFGNTGGTKIEICMKVIDWMDPVMSDERRTEILKSRETCGCTFQDSYSDCDEAYES